MEFSRETFFRWRYEANFEHKIMLAIAFALLTGLCAQIRIPIPWTPVPITMQTFAVFTSAIILGKKWGGVSQAIYVSLGAFGIPWFAGFKGGFAAILGPTGGYLLGFIIAAFFVGYFIDRYIASRFFITLLPLMLFANFVIIHGLGCSWLYAWLSIMGQSPTILQILMMGSIPFIPGDITKILAISAIGKAITPKVSYNGEVDAKKKYRLF
ncbi:MAG: biotin transporter BioY [Archaeoglobaceae archaeon]|nr:biotin transporter BioY [Archaeoglobaceae archaeon]MDW7990158.1 biotin transporter BioY [Archaeoglobaceae archaeon]